MDFIDFEYLTHLLIAYQKGPFYAWSWVSLFLICAFLFSFVVTRLLLILLHRWQHEDGTLFGVRSDFFETFRWPIRFLSTLILFRLFESMAETPEGARRFSESLIQIATILAFAWLFVKIVNFIARKVEEKLDKSSEEELRLRGTRTQIIIVRRLAVIFIASIAVALSLVQFDMVRSLGISLLASAGVAGIVLGLAAQKSLGSLFAGIQLAFTQPIRIGDTVIVEGEWGWIEEIRLTYVVVRIWDLRRLVVPITTFLDTTFQNWSRHSTEIMGTVELYADYMIPVELARAEIERLASESPLWDGKVCTLQVTDATERTIKLRGLVSSATSGDLWNLRCEIREKMILFIRDLEGGSYLPKQRLDSPSGGDVTPPRLVGND